MAHAKREVLLRAYRHLLRREDLEDCYSQATLELLAYARRGGTFSDALHLGNTLELRYLSRIRDLRRALGGRSPMQAAMATALSLEGPDGHEVPIADPRAGPETLVLLRNDLRQMARSARALSADHAGWYVAEVQRWATLYRGSARAPSEAAEELAEHAQGPDARLQGRSPTPVLFIRGARALLAPGDGHLALIPAYTPSTVQAMLVAGNELQELRYGAGGHPDPRGAREEDCSSSVNYVLYRAGIRPIAEILRDNPLAQDYVHWGAPGPGRWVSIYAATAPTAHVFMVIAGLRLDTSHDGTDEGPNSGEDGPRWRLLGHVPDWARWSVRHPSGL